MNLRLNKFRRVRGCLGGSSKSSTSENVNTASGQGNIVSGGGVATQSGSIGVGQGGKYLESGALEAGGDISSGINRSSITAATGSTINIGDPGAISSLVDKFTGAISSLVNPASTGSSSTTTTTTEPMSYKTLGLVVAAFAVVVGLLSFVFGGKKS